MALVGNFHTYTYSESLTDTEEVNITYPENLPEDHDFYKFRGQTKKEIVPVIIETVNTIEDVYLVVHSFVIYKTDISNETKHLVNITYRVYKSKEARESNTEDYIFEDALLSAEIDPSNTTMEQMYNLISEVYGLQDLKKD